MYEKEKDLVSAFVRRKMNRRELIDRMAKLGLGAAAANALLIRATNSAFAQNYDWMAHKGTSLKLLLNKHPYADAMIADLRRLQAADRHGRHLRRLPGGRLFRQGDGGALLVLAGIRRLHDRRLHDLDLRAGRLDHRPQRMHQGSRRRPRPTGPGTISCPASEAPRRGTACPAARSARATPSSGASPGATS